MYHQQLYYIAGVTCAGKDYVIEYCLKNYPEHFSAVQVGKIFRQRYPAGHFQGRGAPDHTETEALAIYNEELDRCFAEGKPAVLIAGQPRRPSQIDLTINENPGKFIWLHCDADTQAKRIASRFADDEQGLELAKLRVKNDKIDLYDVIWKVQACGHHTVATTSGVMTEAIDRHHGNMVYAFDSLV